jgi:hypothetical protein
MTLTAGAGDELAKKLMESAPQLAEIAKAANKLNPALGDTAFMYESIGTGVKRAQPLILDNLGLTIKVGDANEKMAKELGKTVEQLTAEEKAMAILNATLEAGDTLIAQVGGSVESAADDFAQMEVKIKNAKDELLKGLAPAISQVVDEMTPAIDGTVGWVKASALLTDAHERNIITEEELKQQRRALLTFTLTGADAVAWLTQKEELYTETITKTANQIGLTDSWLRKYIESSEDAAEATDDLTDSTEDAKDATKDFKDGLSDLKSFMQDSLGKEMENFEEKQGDLQAEIDETKKKIEEFEALGEGMTDDQVSELEDARTKYGDLQNAYRENADEHDEATKRILFNLIAQRISLFELEGAQLGVMTNIAEQWGILDTETADTVRALDGYFGDLEESGVSSTQAVTQEIMKLVGAQKLVEKDVRITYGINIKGKLPVSSKGLERGATGQHGLSMMVPPGFPNDSFPIWTSSGEHVLVTPRGETQMGRTGRGGRPEKVYQYFSNDRIYIQNSAHARFVIEQRFHEEMDEIDKVL